MVCLVLYTRVMSNTEERETMNTYGLNIINSVFDQATTQLLLGRRMEAAMQARIADLANEVDSDWKSQVQGIAEMLRIDFTTAWEAMETAIEG